jgi:hypothetical protein
MQQRWIDQPASDEAVFDRLLASSSAFLNRHISIILKAGPPLFGFAIFVFYFYRHQFYPSFDLFQFSSLLIAAAAIGFTIIGLLILALFSPGIWIFYQFIQKKNVKDELRYSLPYFEHQRGWWVLKLGSLVFGLPFITCTFGLIAVLVLAPPLFSLSVFLVPVLVSLLFGLIIQVVFELRPFSFLRYMWAADVGVMIAALLTTFTLGQSAPIIEGFQIGAWKWAIYLTVVLIVPLIAALCAFVFVAGWNAALHFSIFFAVLIAFYSGLLTTLPEKTVHALGLGNFQAEAILLERDYCDEPIEQLPLDATCAMNNIHVIWSLGETLILQRDDGGVVQIPSRFVRAIIKPAE